MQLNSSSQIRGQMAQYNRTVIHAKAVTTEITMSMNCRAIMIKSLLILIKQKGSRLDNNNIISLSQRVTYKNQIITKEVAVEYLRCSVGVVLQTNRRNQRINNNNSARTYRNLQHQGKCNTFIVKGVCKSCDD